MTIQLASDPDGMNEKRCEWAARCLDLFKAMTGSTEEQDEDMQDLLTDLMHLADQRGVSFEGVVERARYHYLIESGQREDCS